MILAEFKELIATVWNASSKNVHARPVEGDVFIAEILWPRLQIYSTPTVRKAMLMELAESVKPRIRAVIERCIALEPTAPDPGRAEEPEKTGTEKYLRPFDESRRHEEGYAKMQLCIATLCVGFAANKNWARREGAKVAGLTEVEFGKYLDGLTEKQNGDAGTIAAAPFRADVDDGIPF